MNSGIIFRHYFDNNELVTVFASFAFLTLENGRNVALSKMNLNLISKPIYKVDVFFNTSHLTGYFAMDRFAIKTVI